MVAILNVVYRLYKSFLIGGLAKVKQTALPSLQDTATSSSATQSASADYKERHLGSKVRI